MGSDVTLVDYGAGNIASVVNMVKRLGYTAEVLRDPLKILNATRIILPGVGAFDAGMAKLNEYGLVEPLNELAIRKKVPILGICLGAQLLGIGSEEGRQEGLGWIDFHCRKFVPTGELKVPHMGWNFVHVEQNCSLTQDLPEGSRFYFVHSYYMDVPDKREILFSTNYGITFASGVVKENIYGVQFHPEKSHKFGMHILRNFLGSQNVSE